MNRQVLVQWKEIENWHANAYTMEEQLCLLDKRGKDHEWNLDGITTMMHVWGRWRKTLVGKCSPFSVFTGQGWFQPGKGVQFYIWRDNNKKKIERYII